MFRGRAGVSLLHQPCLVLVNIILDTSFSVWYNYSIDIVAGQGAKMDMKYLKQEDVQSARERAVQDGVVGSTVPMLNTEFRKRYLVHSSKTTEAKRGKITVYQVIWASRDGLEIITCNCQSGRRGQFCKHMAYALAEIRNDPLPKFEKPTMTEEENQLAETGKLLLFRKKD